MLPLGNLARHDGSKILDRYTGVIVGLVDNKRQAIVSDRYGTGIETLVTQALTLHIPIIAGCHGKTNLSLQQHRDSV